jgi:LmbE family N-acetylglucosaminyl deacetylase
MSLEDRLAQAVLVVAHPDDEILWFSGVFPFVKQVIICFLDTPGDDSCTAARRALRARFPADNVEFLGLSESMAYGQANWTDPVTSEFGLWLEGNNSAKPPLPGFSAQRYRTNHGELVQLLKSRLQEAPVVITHNPWGDYGHEEHVQVHRAVTDVRMECGFEVWFSTYASDRSATLMARTIARMPLPFETLVTRPDVVAPIAGLYRETGCWTWPYPDWKWFATESYVRLPAIPPDEIPRYSTMPINWLSIDFSDWLTPRRTLVQRINRRIRRLRRYV